MLVILKLAALILPSCRASRLVALCVLLDDQIHAGFTEKTTMRHKTKENKSGTWEKGVGVDTSLWPLGRRDQAIGQREVVA